MKSLGSVLIPIVLMFVIFLVFVLVEKSGHKKNEYDERQLMIRGKIYRSAFLSTIFVNGCAIIFLSFNESYKVYTTFFFGLAIFLGFGVLTCMSIWKDAFTGTQNDLKKYLLSILIIILCNGSIFFTQGDNSSLSALLQKPQVLNLMAALAGIAILITVLCKIAKVWNEESDDEES